MALNLNQDAVPEHAPEVHEAFQVCVCLSMPMAAATFGALHTDDTHAHPIFIVFDVGATLL
jgi:hypothetical protein